MSDIELIMQLARLEEQEEEDRLGENGLKNDCTDSNEQGGGEGGVKTDITAGLGEGGTSQSAISSSLNKMDSTTPRQSGENDELRALADLEKELGLDDLQLFLDTSGGAPGGGSGVGSVGQTFQSPDGKGSNKSSDMSMAVETGGSITSFATSTTLTSSQKVVDDDDNLDELERYLESLSATPSK